jgi:hypothetical protein
MSGTSFHRHSEPEMQSFSGKAEAGESQLYPWCATKTRNKDAQRKAWSKTFEPTWIASSASSCKALH